MERQPVSSSNIAEIGYDSDTETLEIKFKNDAIYQYFDVPSNINAELMKATDSHGEYLAKHIKGIYRFSKV